MICKECQNQNKKSFVVVTVKRFCDNKGIVYWDEEGTKHIHPYLKTCSKYKCSNNHEWIEWNYSNCQCGWNSNE